MARIRTIKPEFFTSADIVSMSPLSRLFYASLWCEADREGRLKWDVRTLKIRYFPADNCDINAMADELIEAGLIEIYQVDGKQYAQIPTFLDHQIINNREAESSIPVKQSDENHAPFTRESGVQGEGKEGKEGKGKEDASPKKRKPAKTTIPDGFTVSDSVKAWAEANGHSRLEERLAQFTNVCQAKSYEYSDWDAAFRNAIAGDWAKLGKATAKQPDGKFDVNEWARSKCA